MKQVFIYSGRSIFTQGLVQLFEEQPSIHIVGWEANLEKAIEQIAVVSPDAILFVTNDDPSEALSDERRLFQVTGGKAHIIELNFKNDLVSIILGQQLVITEFADLVSLIE